VSALKIRMVLAVAAAVEVAAVQVMAQVVVSVD